MHGRAHGFHAERDERIEVVVEGIAKRRHEDYRAGRPGLVMVVDDLRKPLEEHLAIHVGGLRHVRHVEIAVVVVADVVLKQGWQATQAALRRVGFAHVPVRHQFLAVRIRQHAEQDVVVQNPQSLRVGTAHHLVNFFHLLLRTDGFGGVQASVNPNDRFAFASQSVGLFVCQTFGTGQPPGNIFVMIQPLDCFGRADNRHILAAIFGRWPDIDQFHAIRFRGQLVPVGVKLAVVRHLIVITEIETERFFGRGYPHCVLGMAQHGGDEQKQSETGQKRPSVVGVEQPLRPRPRPGITDESADVRGLRGR